MYVPRSPWVETADVTTPLTTERYTGNGRNYTSESGKLSMMSMMLAKPSTLVRSSGTYRSWVNRPETGDSRLRRDGSQSRAGAVQGTRAEIQKLVSAQDAAAGIGVKVASEYSRSLDKVRKMIQGVSDHHSRREWILAQDKLLK